MHRFFLTALLAAPAVPSLAAVDKPAAITADGVPAVPNELAANSRPYMESRAAGFSGWNARDRSMLIATRFGNVNQLHSVASPMMMRKQVSFEVEPMGGRWSPTGDALVTVKDNGGDEFFQIYTLKDGRLTLLTAGGKSRNEFSGWSEDGKLIGFSSTERNGTDSDLYVMDPRNPGSKRKVADRGELVAREIENVEVRLGDRNIFDHRGANIARREIRDPPSAPFHFGDLTL